MSIIHYETHGGTPIIYRGGKLIPFSQVLRLKPPGFPGGLVWIRPISVMAISADGQEQIIPVNDPTRQIIWMLLGATLLTALFTLIRKKS